MKNMLFALGLSAFFVTMAKILGTDFGITSILLYFIILTYFEVDDIKKKIK